MDQKPLIRRQKQVQFPMGDRLADFPEDEWLKAIQEMFDKMSEEYKRRERKGDKV